MGPELALALDFSYARPDPAAIVAAGYRYVLRYLSLDPAKNLTRDEAAGYLAAGLGIGIVWETTADRATSGAIAGGQDAQNANAQASAIGYPNVCPLYYAVDEQVPWSAVAPYFAGADAELLRVVKAYGSDDVVDGAFGAGFGTGQWQTEAWSGDVVSAYAGLYQRVTPTVPEPIPDTDENAVLEELIWWGGVAPAPVPSRVLVTPAIWRR